MKIAVFHNLPAGGAKRVLHEEVKALSRKHQIDLYIISSKMETFLDLRPYCINVINLEFKLKRFKKFNRVLEDLQILINLRKVHKKIASLINSKDYDAALVHPDIYTNSPFLLKFLKIPSVYYCHEWYRIVYEDELSFRSNNFVSFLYEKISRAIKKSIDYKNIRSATTVLTNSNYTRNNIKKAYGIISSVVYPGVDGKVFYSISKKKKKQLIFIGDPNFINGFNLISPILNFLNQEKIDLEIIKTKHINKINDLFLAKKYSESMALLSLSYNEPFGLSPLEAISCKTPVIALNEGGYKETISKNFGILINRSSYELKDAIKKISEKTFYVKTEGNKYIKKNWSWKKHCKKIEKILLSYDQF